MLLQSEFLFHPVSASVEKGILDLLQDSDCIDNETLTYSLQIPLHV